MNVRALLLGLAFVLGTAPSASGQYFVPDTSHAVHVTGRASIDVVPDLATVELGVFAIDNDARKAKAVVDAAIAKVVALAKTLGVSTESMRTAAVNVQPRYDMENASRFRGYEVTRSVTVVVKELEQLDPLLDGAVQAGANRNFVVTLTSSREVAVRREALSMAITDARSQAELAAKQLGVRLGTVRSINLNRTGMETHSVSSSIGFGSSSAEFLPGTIKIRAEASVTFTIADVAK